MVSFRNISLVILLLLTSRLSAQSIGVGVTVEPATYTLLPRVTVHKEPKYGYKTVSNSKPSFAIQLYRETKSNWGYGVEMSFFSNTRYVSINYNHPVISGWEKRRSSSYFERQYLGVNFFVSKRVGKFTFMNYVGIYKDYGFSEDAQPTTGSINPITIAVGSEGTYRLGGYGYIIDEPRRTFSTKTFGAKVNYEVANDFRIGISLRYGPFSRLIRYFSYEEEQGELGEVIVLADKKVGDFVVFEDKLSWSVTLAYSLSKPLNQKRKKARQERKELRKGE